MKKEGYLVQGWVGAALIGIGGLAIIGWIWHLPLLISVLSGYVHMVFNTALCLLLAGIALLLPLLYPPLEKKLWMAVGGLLILIAGLTLSQYIFNYSLGIDKLFIEPWLADQNPFPGRMAYTAAISFILCGFCFILIPTVQKKHYGLLIQLLIFIIILAAICSILSYLVKFQFLYDWYAYTRMAIHPSLGFILLGIGLSSSWQRYESQLVWYPEYEIRKILLLSSFFLFCVALITAMVSFVVISDSKVPSADLIPLQSYPESTFYLLNAQEFRLAVILDIFIIIVGISLFYWQVSPLVKRTVDSERNARENFEKLQKNEVALLEAETELKYRADHDALTGLVNRTVLKNSMLKDLAYAERHNQYLAVLFFDIDHFKTINDTYGHDVGDLVLKEIADRLLKNTRGFDTAARIGGDEFILVLTEVHSLDAIKTTAKKIIELIEKPITLADRELKTTTTIGISVYPTDGNDPQTLIKKADIALYQAKNQGRDNYHFFSEEKM